MLNPKLQTLNSFGFLRESKKTLNIPGTLLQEIIITSRIDNKALQEHPGLQRSIELQIQRSRFIQNTSQDNLHPFFNKGLNNMNCSSKVQHQEQSEPGEPFCLALEITSKFKSIRNCNKVQIICKPNAEMISFHLF